MGRYERRTTPPLEGFRCCASQVQQVLHAFGQHCPVGRLLGDICARNTHREADVGGLQGRGIIDSWPPPEVEENINLTEVGNLGVKAEEEAAIVAFVRRCRMVIDLNELMAGASSHRQEDAVGVNERAGLVTMSPCGNILPLGRRRAYCPAFRRIQSSRIA